MWKDYFSFNKRQRNGIIVLLALILLMMGWLIISNHIAPLKGNVDFSQFKSEVANANSSSRAVEPIPVDSKAIPESQQKSVVKISLNGCTIKELSHNPNIGFYLAQAIVNYRELHGPYKKIEDLLNNKAIDDSTFAKISPYLKVE
jgi:competence ComEA-like helix-hairpin-helix protein